MTELKPCPFCGGKANFFVKVNSTTGTHRGWKFGVYCTMCDSSLPRNDYVLDVDFDPNGEITIVRDERNDAIEAWNRRANNG